MFKHAITRTPSSTIAEGLTSANLGAVDYVRAKEQHKSYIAALEDAGLDVTVLEPMDAFPDATFVEDVALLAPPLAIVTAPGAPERAAEVEGIRQPLNARFSDVREIEAPGKLEAGDVMRVENHFFFGLSDRTNEEGARQAIAHLESLGYTGSLVNMSEMLHLKTGVNYLGDGHMLVYGEFCGHEAFKDFICHEIAEEEAYAANSLRINDRVLVPKGYPKTLAQVTALGFKTVEVDTSEFKKIDGGLSCLSLRY